MLWHALCSYLPNAAARGPRQLRNTTMRGRNREESSVGAGGEEANWRLAIPRPSNNLNQRFVPSRRNAMQVTWRATTGRRVWEALKRQSQARLFFLTVAKSNTCLILHTFRERAQRGFVRRFAVRLQRELSWAVAIALSSSASRWSAYALRAWVMSVAGRLRIRRVGNRGATRQPPPQPSPQGGGDRKAASLRSRSSMTRRHAGSIDAAHSRRDGEPSALRPSPAATDGEWCRRVYLDLDRPDPHGRRARRVTSRTRARSKRAELVDRLLGDEYREEYARNWKTVWTNLLIGRTGGTERRSLTSRPGMTAVSRGRRFWRTSRTTRWCGSW